MKNECSIIRDILPLYVENMVSEDTAEFVKEHLESCPVCRAELEKLREPVEVQTEPQPDMDAAPLKRRREQPLVSFQRTLDLKRYAQDAGKPWSKDIIVHKIGEKTYSKSINDAYYQSLPIDNAILQYNSQWGIAENNSLFEPYNAW